MMASETFKTYLFSYQHQGSSWVVEIKAESPEDAKRRVEKLRSAKFDGELIAKLVVPSPMVAVVHSARQLVAALFRPFRSR